MQRRVAKASLREWVRWRSLALALQRGTGLVGEEASSKADGGQTTVEEKGKLESQWGLSESERDRQTDR